MLVGTSAYLWDENTVACIASGILVVPLAADSRELSAKIVTDEDMPAMSDDFAALLDSIRSGQAPAMSADRRILAEEAVKANQARSGEDIDDWAYRIAAAVSGAND